LPEMSAATDLNDARYVNLLSFKRDGGEAKTPVWAAPIDGKLGIYTAGDSYKVKRIRRNPAVRVARCDVRGELKGPWHEGTCAIVEDPAERARILEALLRKYGWQMRILNFFATVSGRAKKRVFLEVTVR
jgi:PPOX class probable F420-dependent enzyme